MDLAMLLLTVATLILAGTAVHYGRKAVSEASSANKLASERSVVGWHVDRKRDDNPGVFFVANTPVEHIQRR